MSNYLPEGCTDEMYSSAPDFSGIPEDPDNVIEMPNRAECKHDWKEEYYGWHCVHCRLFYAFGCAPWEFAEDDDFDTFDGEHEDCEE